MAFFSCRTPYDPDIEADKEILVVDAFVTNHAHASYVKLNLARPFDLDGVPPTVHKATVYLTDKNQNKIYFQETSMGYYEPADTTFAGEINESYELTVETPDGCIYRSNPETIPEDMMPSKVYGGYDQEAHLAKDAMGKTIRVTEDVCAMYFDYTGDAEVPHFRYTSSQLVEYFITRINILFCCWMTDTDNSLRLTYQKYASSSSDIYKQEVSTSPPNINLIVASMTYADGSSEWIASGPLIQVYEYKRIAEIKQYRLNEDSYEYYKQVKAQSEAEGKLFDPINSQIKGNISCINFPSKTVLGFFEASNLMTMSFDINRYDVGYAVTISQVGNVAPHPWKGFTVDLCPDFWVP
jgi:hypothetical protein